MHLFWQFVMVAVVNAWLLYRRNCNLRNIPKKQWKKRRVFQAELSTALISGKVQVSDDDSDDNRDDAPPENKKRKFNPDHAVRYDRIDHLPIKETRGRCAHCYASNP